MRIPAAVRGRGTFRAGTPLSVKCIRFRRRGEEKQSDDGFRLNAELPAVNRGSGNGADEAAIKDKTALKDGGKAVGLGEGNNGLRIQKQIENFPAGNESESGVNGGVNGVVFFNVEFGGGYDDDECSGKQS